MSKKRDLIGNKFDRLTVLYEAQKIRGRTASVCLCQCGNKITVVNNALITGNTKSCGCRRKDSLVWKDNLNKGRTTHGLTSHPLNPLWSAMRGRCNNKNYQDYRYYGGRGIKVCKEWEDDFLNFYNWAISNGWERGLTIERIDNNLGYSPENCRWATRKEQARNKRNTIRLTYNGQTLSISDWSDLNKLGLTAKIIKERLGLGWPVDRILNTPKLTRYGNRH